jgi:hypothetical protein
MFFCQNSLGGQGFLEKLPGGYPYFGFYSIFINKCFEICLRGVLYLPSPYPTSPPTCVHLCESKDCCKLLQPAMLKSLQLMLSFAYGAHVWLGQK